MRKFLIISFLAVSLLAFLAVTLSAQEVKKEAKKDTEETAKHEYVGVKKCKTCHKPQYTSWLETKHAKTFDVLSDEEKKKEECVVCHSTGKMADGTLIVHAECEACHGPGKDYKSMKIMNKKKWAADPETYKKLSIEAGLIYPKDEDCRRCHRPEGNENFKEFNFEKMMPLVHTMNTEKKASGGK